MPVRPRPGERLRLMPWPGDMTTYTHTPDEAAASGRARGADLVVHLSDHALAEGRPKSPTQCALALALRAHRHVQTAVRGHHVHVGQSTVTVRAERYDHIYRMPAAARRTVADYDAGRPVGSCHLLLVHDAMEDRVEWERGAEAARERARAERLAADAR